MATRSTHRTAARAGFSLAELMVVIVIIGLLATLVVPNVVRKLGKANTTKAKADIVSIAKAVEDYVIENNGRYPDSIEALIQEDEKGESYLNKSTVPKDPWGNPYVYEPPTSGSRKFRVLSYGKDGVPGGDGDDADIDNVTVQDGG
jgi:general secretion pathway protein G